MRRQIEWIEKNENGEKRTVRVDFFGKKIRWQEKVGETPWRYDFTPSIADWETLEVDVFRRYQRRRASLEDLQLVRKFFLERKNFL